MVLPFGTTYATADFQWYINAIREVVEDCASAYLHDVLIYKNLEREHVELVKWVMQHVLEAGLHLNIEKHESHKETVQYLGLYTSTKGISTDPDKVETIQNCRRE